MYDNLDDYDWMPEMTKFLYEMNPNYVKSYGDGPWVDANNNTIDDPEMVKLAIDTHRKNLEAYGRVTSYLATQAIAPGVAPPEDGPGAVPVDWRIPEMPQPDTVRHDPSGRVGNPPNTTGVAPEVDPSNPNATPSQPDFNLPVNEPGGTPPPSDEAPDSDDEDAPKPEKKKEKGPEPPKPPGDVLDKPTRAANDLARKHIPDIDPKILAKPPKYPTALVPKGKPVDTRITKPIAGTFAAMDRGARILSAIPKAPPSTLAKRPVPPPPTLAKQAPPPPTTLAKQAPPPTTALAKQPPPPPTTLANNNNNNNNDDSTQLVKDGVRSMIREQQEKTTKQISKQPRSVQKEIVKKAAATPAPLPATAEGLAMMRDIFRQEIAGPIREIAQALNRNARETEALAEVVKASHEQSDRTLQKGFNDMTKELTKTRDQLDKVGANITAAMSEPMADVTKTVGGLSDALRRIGVAMKKVAKPPGFDKKYDELNARVNELSNPPPPVVNLDPVVTVLTKMNNEAVKMRTDLEELKKTTETGLQKVSDETKAQGEQLEKKLDDQTKAVDDRLAQQTGAIDSKLAEQNVNVQGQIAHQRQEIKDTIDNRLAEQNANLRDNPPADNSAQITQILNAYGQRMTDTLDQFKNSMTEMDAKMMQLETQRDRHPDFDFDALRGQVDTLNEKLAEYQAMLEQTKDVSISPEDKQQLLDALTNRMNQFKDEFQVAIDYQMQGVIQPFERQVQETTKEIKALNDQANNNLNLADKPAQPPQPEAPAPLPQPAAIEKTRAVPVEKAPEPIQEEAPVEKAPEPVLIPQPEKPNNTNVMVIEPTPDIVDQTRMAGVTKTALTSIVTPVNVVIGGITTALDFSRIAGPLNAVNSTTMRLMTGGRQMLKHTMNNVFGALGSMYNKVMSESMTQQQKDARDELTAYAQAAKTVIDTEQKRLLEKENAMRDVGIVDAPVTNRKRKASDALAKDDHLASFFESSVSVEEPEPKRSKTEERALTDLEEQRREELSRPMLHIEGVSETENNQRTRNINVLTELIQRKKQLAKEHKEVEKKIEDTNPLTGGLEKQAENAHTVQVVSNTNVQEPAEIAAERLEIGAEYDNGVQGVLTEEDQAMVDGELLVPGVPQIRTKAQAKAFMRFLNKVADAYAGLCYQEDITRQQAAQIIRQNTTALQQELQDGIRKYNNNVVPKEAEVQLEVYNEVIAQAGRMSEATNDFAAATEQRTMISDEVASENYGLIEGYLGTITKSLMDGDEESFKQARLDIARDDNPVTLVQRAAIEEYMGRLQQAVIDNIQSEGGEFDFRQVEAMYKLMNQTTRMLGDNFHRTKVMIINDFIRESKRAQKAYFEEPESSDEDEDKPDDDDDMSPEDLELFHQQALDARMRISKFTRGRLLRHMQKGLYQSLTVMETMAKSLGVENNINPGEILRDALKNMKGQIQQGYNDPTQDDPEAVRAEKQVQAPEAPADRTFNRFAEKQAKPLIGMKTFHQFEAWEQKKPNAAAAVETQASADLAKIRQQLTNTPPNQPLSTDLKLALMSYLSSGYSYHRAKYDMFNNRATPSLHELVGSKSTAGVQKRLATPDDWINEPEKREKLVDIMVMMQNKVAGGDVVQAAPAKPRVQQTTRVSDQKGQRLDQTAKDAQARIAEEEQTKAQEKAKRVAERKKKRQERKAVKEAEEKKSQGK